MAPLEVHDIGTTPERRRQVGETLELVGLNASFIDRYPHQLSGGQRQRVAIARAIILEPSLVVADEPTSALDVSVQAQILNLFRDTRRDLGLTYLFVSHNLGVIRYVSDRVAVMRLGRIVEQGTAEQIFTAPQHEYTQALLSAVPDIDPAKRRPPTAAE
jgi:ABC-type oligopeptide transport system ATPase subunit